MGFVALAFSFSVCGILKWDLKISIHFVCFVFFFLDLKCCMIQLGIVSQLSFFVILVNFNSVQLFLVFTEWWVCIVRYHCIRETRALVYDIQLCTDIFTWFVQRYGYTMIDVWFILFCKGCFFDLEAASYSFTFTQRFILSVKKF